MENGNFERLNQEGDEYLDMLGFSDLADEPIPSRPDLKWREFMQICGEHARPAFVALKAIGPDHPLYARGVEELRTRVRELVDPESAEA